MATAIKIHQRLRETVLNPFLTPAEKLAILRDVKGIWKNRKPDPIKELAKMRKGWERKLPKLK